MSSSSMAEAALLSPLEAVRGRAQRPGGLQAVRAPRDWQNGHQADAPEIRSF